MNVDWDGIAEKAEDSPASRLAEVQALVDDITFVYVAYVMRDGGFRFGWGAVPEMPRVGSLVALGLLNEAIGVEEARTLQDDD